MHTYTPNHYLPQEMTHAHDYGLELYICIQLARNEKAYSENQEGFFHKANSCFEDTEGLVPHYLS